MKKFRVLIVEDDVLIRLLTNRILTRNNCNVIGETGYAEESIKMVDLNKPDFICMDIKLQGNMNGLDAAKIIIKRYNIPIIFMSAYDFKNEVINLTTVCKTYFIDKPITDKEVKEILKLL